MCFPDRPDDPLLCLLPLSGHPDGEAVGTFQVLLNGHLTADGGQTHSVGLIDLAERAVPGVDHQCRGIVLQHLIRGKAGTAEGQLQHPEVTAAVQGGKRPGALVAAGLDRVVVVQRCIIQHLQADREILFDGVPQGDGCHQRAACAVAAHGDAVRVSTPGLALGVHPFHHRVALLKGQRERTLPGGGMNLFWNFKEDAICITNSFSKQPRLR